MCAASALLGRKVKHTGIQGFSPFYPGMAWEGLKSIGRFVFGGGYNFFLSTCSLNCVVVPGSLPSTTGIETIILRNGENYSISNSAYFSKKQKIKRTKTSGGFSFLIVE